MIQLSWRHKYNSLYVYFLAPTCPHRLHVGRCPTGLHTTPAEIQFGPTLEYNMCLCCFKECKICPPCLRHHTANSAANLAVSCSTKRFEPPKKQVRPTSCLGGNCRYEGFIWLLVFSMAIVGALIFTGNTRLAKDEDPWVAVCYSPHNCLGLAFYDWRTTSISGRSSPSWPRPLQR